MKTNRNVWRVLSLVLALVMLLAVVACTKNDDTDPAKTTAGNAAATTTAKKTTTATKKPEASKTAAITTTGIPTKASGSTVISGTDAAGAAYEYELTNYAPDFTIETALGNLVTLKGAGHLATDVAVTELEKDYNGKKLKHYWINPEAADAANGVMSWTVNLAHDADYNFIFNLYLADKDARSIVLQVNDGEKQVIDLTFGDSVAAFTDHLDNTYVSGIVVKGLKAGENTIKLLPSTTANAKPMQFREIYVTPIIDLQVLNAFSSTLPEKYAGADAIKVDMDAGLANVTMTKKDSKTDITEADADQTRLFADQATADDLTKPSANKTIRLITDTLYHYYLNNTLVYGGEKTDFIGSDTPYMRWTFTVPEGGDGYYNFCFQFRLKDDTIRSAIITIDNEVAKSQLFIYDTQGKRNDIVGENQNAFLEGYGYYLKAGAHTFTITMPANHNSSWHFRGIYLVKADRYDLGAADFSTTLPEKFAADGAIKVAGGVCEEGVTSIVQQANNKNAYNMKTIPATLTKASAHAAIKLCGSESKKTEEEQMFHYYIDKALEANKNLANCYITWTFEVKEAGIYEVASYHRLKSDKRGGIITIDNKDQFVLYYDASSIEKEHRDYLTKETVTVPVITDEYAGAYLTWKGVEIALEPGVHTITYTMDANISGSSIHWRDFYFVKQTPIMVDAFDASNFSSVLPAAFTGNNVIKIDCSSLDAGVGEIQTITENSNYRLVTRNDTGAPSANGAVKLAINGFYHYYLEPMHWASTEDWDLYDHYMRWGFTVPEDGWYDVCFNFRLKNHDQRYSQIQIDNAPVKEQYALTYTMTKEQASDPAIRNNEIVNTYMTGWKIYLTKGDHTFTARMPDYTEGFKAASDNSCPSFHYRNIYFVKGDAPAA